jgi:glycosyltransferase involved in cell wall biosynthesis
LFGASNAVNDLRKGFQFLPPVLQKLKHHFHLRDQIELAIFGSSQPAHPPGFGFKANYFGPLNDDSYLSLLYSAADVFVAPSVEDNLPNTVMEALACGTPCASFEIGGMSDMVEHQVNGYLAKAFDSQDLANGIAWVLDYPDKLKLRENARYKAIHEYSLAIQARKYLLLYQSLLQQKV